MVSVLLELLVFIKNVLWTVLPPMLYIGCCAGRRTETDDDVERIITRVVELSLRHLYHGVNQVAFSDAGTTRTKYVKRRRGLVMFAVATPFQDVQKQLLLFIIQ